MELKLSPARTLELKSSSRRVPGDQIELRGYSETCTWDPGEVQELKLSSGRALKAEIQLSELWKHKSNFGMVALGAQIEI